MHVSWQKRMEYDDKRLMHLIIMYHLHYTWPLSLIKSVSKHEGQANMTCSYASTRLWAFLLCFTSLIPGALPSKFTTSEKPHMELVMWCKHQNVLFYILCIILNVFWGHNIVLGKESWEKNLYWLIIWPHNHNLCE